MIGRNYSLPRIEGRTAQYGIVSKRIVDNKECNILSNLLRAIINRHGQCHYTEGVYSRSSKPDERCIGQYKPFFRNPYLLEHRLIEDISKASIILYPYVNNECIVIWVVETSSIFL